MLGKKRIPLTVPGKSLRGVCLVCTGPNATPNIIPEASQMMSASVLDAHHQSSDVPRELVVAERPKDDETVVSGITLDHRFEPDESDDEESGQFFLRPGSRRPEPSLGDPDDYETRPNPLRRICGPTPLRPISQQGHQQNSGPLRQVTEEGLREQFSSLDAFMGGPPPASASPSSWMMENRRSYFPPDIQEHDNLFMSSSHKLEEKTEIEPTPNPESNLQRNGMGTYLNQCVRSSDIKDSPQAPSVPLHGTPTFGQGGTSKSLVDIPVLITHLQSFNDEDHVVAIQTLADIVWEYGQQAKICIIDQKGLTNLTQSMWNSMANASVQEAALNLLFALAASSDGLGASDVLTLGTSAEDAIDALLIVMQTHLTMENIQHVGCGILACLSVATANNPNVDDASMSGALVSVVSAMEAHRNSRGIQEWGIRALYNQCVYSRHAESNKRTLAKSGMEENKCGAAVIYRATATTENDMVAVEWACRLYWCLSASEDVAEFLTVTPHPIQVILEALQRYHQVTDAVGLLLAIFGALVNLVKVRGNHKVVDSNVLSLVVKVAQSHTNEDLLIESCALVANLVSLAPENARFAVSADAIDVTFNGLQAFPENAQLFEEAMRCLTCLSIASEEAKEILCQKIVLSILTNMHTESAFGQEMFVNLMGSIMTRDGPQHTIVAHGGVDMVCSAMKAHPSDRKVQEAGCLSLRNLACHSDENLRIDFRETINCVTIAMAKHESSESIQLNGCCILWQFWSRIGNGIDCESSDKEMINFIVKAMQTHMESAAVLEMACGALCSKINGSPEGKKCLVDSGGLDAVTCVLVMHPNESAAIENALGVLSCMSASSNFALDVANAQCMGNVVEAMRANNSCITLLEFGCLVLRNIILLQPEHCSESSGVVATILNAMSEYTDDIAFQREACNLIWTMAAADGECKSKVLSLDGIAVLLNCLEKNSLEKDIQDAALGAFNQLSTGST